MLGNKANKGDLSRWILISLLFLIATGIAVTRISDTYITVGGQNVTNQATCTVSLDGTGDYNTIQGCVNLPIGAHIYVKNGTHTISTNTVTLKSNTTLECDSAAVIKLASSTNKDMFNSTNGATNIKILGCVIDENEAGQGATAYGIRLYNVTDSEIRGNSIKNSRDSAIWIDGTDSKRNVISNNWFHWNFAGAAVIVDGVDHQILNNHMINDKRALGAGMGIYIRKSNHTLVDGNKMYGSEMGISISEYTTRDIIVTNNEAFNTYDAGYKISDTKNTIVTGNKAVNCTYGVDIGANSDGSIFSNNQVYNSSSWGFYLKSNNTVFSGNIGYNNGIDSANKAGLTVVDSINNSIIGNVFFDSQATPTQGYGILESGISNTNVYVGNRLWGNSVSDFKLAGTGNFVLQLGQPINATTFYQNGNAVIDYSGITANIDMNSKNMTELSWLKSATGIAFDNDFQIAKSDPSINFANAAKTNLLYMYYDTATDKLVLSDPGVGAQFKIRVSDGMTQIGSGAGQVNITMTSPDASEWCCGVSNAGAFSCSAGAC